MEKKLCISLIFSNFVVSKHKVIIFHAMHNLYANFVKILEICKNFSINLVNELGIFLAQESSHVFQTSKLLL